MTRRVWMALLLLVGLSQGAFAQHDGFSPKLELGRRLYEQSCGVCHTRPTLVSRMYGPELNSKTVGGSADAAAAIITNGTARMPAFKYTYNPEQISAIAAYVVTLAPGHQGDGK